MGAVANGLQQNFGRTALFLVCLMLSVHTFADTQDIESANNQMSVQFQSQDMNHAETVNGAVIDSEDAHIAGYGLSGSLMKDLWLGHDFFAAQYSSFHGESTYVGSTIGNPVYGSLIEKSGAKNSDFNLRYGNGYIIDVGLMVTPYGELGYHQYYRTLGYGTPGNYLETYTHYYYGIGVMGQISPTDKIVWSANVLIGRTFGANISVGLPAPFGFSARMGNSALYKMGTSLDYAFTKNLHGNIGVDVASWKYGASASQPVGFGLYLYEPDSKTNNTTFKVGIGFSF